MLTREYDSGSLTSVVRSRTMSTSIPPWTARNIAGDAHTCEMNMLPGSAPAQPSGAISGGTRAACARPMLTASGSKSTRSAFPSALPSSRRLNFSSFLSSWMRRANLTKSPPAEIEGSLVLNAASTTRRPSRTSDCWLRARKRRGSTPLCSPSESSSPHGITVPSSRVTAVRRCCRASIDAGVALYLNVMPSSTAPCMMSSFARLSSGTGSNFSPGHSTTSRCGCTPKVMRRCAATMVSMPVP
mmetsp:Transcript_19704/g.47730  ORF Transcript_19704/g.47730 Transcript_19704/m.47730 type:complete len:243 (-) Transcript_19704:2544-3272(-)